MDDFLLNRDITRAASMQLTAAYWLIRGDVHKLLDIWFADTPSDQLDFKCWVPALVNSKVGLAVLLFAGKVFI